MIDDLTLAGELAREAGRLAARMLADGLETRHKSSVSDVVSAADQAAEELIAERLREQRPADGLVGEEGAYRPGGRTWFVDPVDGTYNFLAGLPFWCSAVALVEQPTDADASPEPAIGAVYYPLTDELWVGGVGRSATSRNGVPVRPLVDAPLAELSLASYQHPPRLADPDVREPMLAAISGAATLRMLGSGSIELAQVASGRLGAWVQLNCPDWDWLPGAALVRAAGGRAEVFQHRGQRWHVAGNRQAVADIRQRVTSCHPHAHDGPASGG
ncbi:MAG TPA: inositol monophosphatase family protein [Jatrophihabitans sp.]|nr:inositol monophosphatase family protein [Jatrophihabitans sp.]